MTPPEFQTLAQSALGDDWRRQLPAVARVKASTVWRWVNGKMPVRASVIALLETIRDAKR